MPQKKRIIPVQPFNREKRLELAKLLIEAGFTVREGKDKIEGKIVYFVEYYAEDE